jgi:superfamily II DNA or RNA helicase
VKEELGYLIETGPTILFINENTTKAVRDFNEELRRNQGINPEFFTYDHQSQFILDKWAEGSFNPLLSLTILDEGIDVPKCSAVILLDSSEEDDRQWIQRRGRALRVDPDNDEAKAIIHDFLPFNNEENPSQWALEWLENNSRRILEFVKLSPYDENKTQILNLITDLQSEVST